MADAPAVGAGAGDTGNANALGEWLAGNDQDAISAANRARSQGRAIDPWQWPGGIRLILRGQVLDAYDLADLELRIYLEGQEGKRVLVRHPRMDDEGRLFVDIEPDGFVVEDGSIGVAFRPEGVKSAKTPMQRFASESIVPPADLQPSDRLVVEARIESVHEVSP